MQAKGLTQEELARRSHLTVGTIRNVLKAKHPPRAATKKLIAEALGVSEEILFTTANIIADNKEGESHES